MQLDPPTEFAFSVPRLLDSNEVLASLHIYKCAGGSFHRVLLKLLGEKPALVCHREEQLQNMTPSTLYTYRFVRGHVGYRLMDYYAPSQKPLWVTFLRNPLDRVVSQYFFARQTHDEATALGNLSNEAKFIMGHSFEEYAHSRCGGANNHQTRELYLRRGEQWNEKKQNKLEILDTVKHRLSTECVFFGLTEKFQHSLQLMYYTFAWRPFELDSKSRLHVTHDKPKSDDLTPAVIEVVHQKNDLDFEIYKFAEALFERRYQAMLSDLSHRFNDGKPINAEKNIAQLLHKHFLTYAPKRFERHSYPAIRYDDPILDHPELAEGWYAKENGFRWTGPATDAVLYLNLPTEHAVQVQFDISHPSDYNVLYSCCLFVNGQTIPLKHTPGVGKLRMEGRINKEILRSSSSLTEIRLQVPRTSHPDGKDQRSLGVQFHAMHIVPDTNT